MSTFAALTTLFLFSGLAVSGDVTWPSCNVSSFDWTYNTLSQSPCEVAAYLESTCWLGGYTLWPLVWQERYTGPTDKSLSNLCLCNTVVYSLLCACGACQEHNWISWEQWTTNCTTTMPPSTFPNPIPPPIQIPHWALIDVTLENFWVPDTAKSAGDSPEIGPGKLINASSSSTGPTGSATPSSWSGRSSTRTILGGVVGAAIATLVFAIVILVVFYVRRRKRKNSGARMAVAEDTTTASPSMAGPALTSTAMEIPDPIRLTAGMMRPEMQATPWTPDVSSQVVFGPYQGSGTTLPMQSSPKLPPQYDDLPTIPA